MFLQAVGGAACGWQSERSRLRRSSVRAAWEDGDTHVQVCGHSESVKLW